MKKLLVLAVAGASFLHSSCKKEEHPAPVTATLEVTAPLANQEFTVGDTVFIKGSVKSERSLHGYHVTILGLAGDSAYHTHNHSHGNEIIINEWWIAATDSTAVYDLILDCPTDHEGGMVSKTIPIKINH